MAMPRLTGFVVGCDTNGDGHPVWKVRVKDARSTSNGQKLVVASVHDGIELAKGLNVHFILGVMDGPDGTKVHRAVDVQPEHSEALPATR